MSTLEVDEEIVIPETSGNFRDSNKKCSFKLLGIAVFFIVCFPTNIVVLVYSLKNQSHYRSEIRPAATVLMRDNETVEEKQIGFNESLSHIHLTFNQTNEVCNVLYVLYKCTMYIGYIKRIYMN